LLGVKLGSRLFVNEHVVLKRLTDSDLIAITVRAIVGSGWESGGTQPCPASAGPFYVESGLALGLTDGWRPPTAEGRSTEANDEDDRREFLKTCGRFAAVTPPIMTALLSTTLTTTAVTASSGNTRHPNNGWGTERSHLGADVFGLEVAREFVDPADLQVAAEDQPHP
jgi:hypothetical protein